MLDLDPIKARLAAATPGPWKFDSTWIPAYRRDRDWLRSSAIDAGVVLRVFEGSMLKGDAYFIENSPTDIAALVAEVERLRALVAGDA